jgi:hypothetical protein
VQISNKMRNETMQNVPIQIGQILIAIHRTAEAKTSVRGHGTISQSRNLPKTEMQKKHERGGK